MGLIFSLSSGTAGQAGPTIWTDFVVKKTGHMFLFGVLYGLAFWATKKPKRAILISLIYAFLDEWHQSFTPGRSPRLVDVGFDAVGIGLMYLKIGGFI